MSSAKKLCSGVPQGSVLGPLLFIIFINNITDNLPKSIKTLIFADDLKTYARISDSNGIHEFKNTLSELSSWAERWQLPISCGKSNWLFISNRMDLLDTECFYLSNSVFNQVLEIKDLGILFDSKLNFDAHISSIIANAKKRLFLLRKSFVTHDVKILLNAFITYVRPLLEYCSQVWSPHTKKDIDRIEAVQRGFTKRLHGFEKLDYQERLFKANLFSLELRRLRSDLILCYKIIHKLIGIDMSNLFELDSNVRTWGHTLKIRAVRPRLEIRKHFYANRIVAVWNDLPAWCVENQNLLSFKKLIITVDHSKHLINNHDFRFYN